MDNFSAVAKAAWSTDDGKTTFCVPMASVIHGFIYNKDALKKVGASEPKTTEEFNALLEKLKKDGTYTPLVMGTADQWEAATMGFQNIGPDYWKGETGREDLIKGTEKFTDPEYVDVFKELASWAPFMGNGYQAQKYADSQNLFSLGKGAIYPAGSWDISTFRANAKFPMGAFKPPLPAGDTQCYISDHTDIGMGLNAASKNQADAKKVPGMAGDAGIRDDLRQRPARLLPAVQGAGGDQGRSRGDLRLLAQGLQVDDPQLLPDPLARHAESGKRTLERVRAGHQRGDDAGRRRQTTAGRPRQVVPSGQISAAAWPGAPGHAVPVV